MGFLTKLLSNSVFMAFLALALGYLFGRISFGGLKFGTSGVLIVALILGSFGMKIPDVLGSIGLVMFLGCVGLSAGPSFVTNIKANFWGFIATTLAILLSAGVTIAMAVKIFNLPIDLSLGVMAGALTCTASLTSTLEIVGSDSAAGVGYALAYVFGIISIVLFVQIIPKLFKANVEEENAKIPDPPVSKRLAGLKNAKLITMDAPGVFVVCITIAFGVMLGAIAIPVGGGLTFSLGNGGGAIIAGIVISAIGKIGKINFQAPKTTLVPMRDFGISLFLLANGAAAGPKFVSTLSQYGITLFLVGVLMSVVAILAAFVVSRYLFKMPLFASLGATTGAMTSAPALNALMLVSGNDKVAAFYAACQPIATVGLVILPRIMVGLLH
ncbi:antiporter [Caproicibacterium sp. BJN0003]|uniref:aspartate-alanine antiporter-like transporter n=1 Tax=Caproicibacterium sp. BJN0003 TaxID=2994078 RepID=UPI0022598A80|nr:antiporter [Caproicibacterium sp. BJN0003]UZT81447.1 antiporter [Caproicibacterium sp. BJN0003]